MAWLRGFYGVLDREDGALAEALFADASVVQVRVKDDPERLQRVAEFALPYAREHRKPLIVNDSVDIALEVGADGVHVGQNDASIEEIRKRAPRGFICGLSTHNPAEVAAACRAGADYLGFGPVFETTTKARPDPTVGLSGLADAVRVAGETPVVAIGGISVGDASDIAACGAAAACAISAVNQAPCPRTAASVIRRAF